KILLRTMCGLRPLREGRMFVLDHISDKESYMKDWDDLLPRSIRAKIGVSLEVDGLLINVSVQEGMEMLFRFRFGDHSVRLREGARKAVESLGAKFGISDIMGRRPVELTSSERKLGSLARSFLARPSMLLLEDPSHGVGELSTFKLW